MLTAANRCDWSDCDARAYLRVYGFPRGELYFCGHHANQIDDLLIEYPWEDERPNILNT